MDQLSHPLLCFLLSQHYPARLSRRGYGNVGRKNLDRQDENLKTFSGAWFTVSVYSTFFPLLSVFLQWSVIFQKQAFTSPSSLWAHIHFCLCLRQTFASCWALLFYSLTSLTGSFSETSSDSSAVKVKTVFNLGVTDVSSGWLDCFHLLIWIWARQFLLPGDWFECYWTLQ